MRLQTWRVLALGLGMIWGCTPLWAGEPTVSPAGVFRLPLPGLSVRTEGDPKVLLWCQGVKLHGVVLPDGTVQKPGPTQRTASAPTGPPALVIRDGRCGSEQGRISFGFLLPMKAWVFEGAAKNAPAKNAPEERTTWLLHRFEGSLEASRLKGKVVQVDVSHPGYSFRESGVEGEGLAEEQASFGSEGAWLTSMGATFSLEPASP